ncbi:MAG: hypothetical protein MTP17_00335 [Candidatus Midichloria sp.]|nr:MAG: hypothetical protein MTP17_00335 [Candidatus Midichloria sp.]
MLKESDGAKLNLAKKLGYHSLGIVQALSYMSKTRKFIDIYLSARDKLMTVKGYNKVNSLLDDYTKKQGIRHSFGN